MKKRAALAPLSPEKEKALQVLFESLPEDFDGRYAALQKIREAIHRALGNYLEKALNERAKSLPDRAIRDRQKIQSWVDQVTRDMGLTVACPETGKPGLLIAHTRGPKQLQFNHYAILVADEKRGGYLRTPSTLELPHLKLVPAPSNIESLFADYRIKSSSSRSR